jgi:hypothetical protein
LSDKARIIGEILRTVLPAGQLDFTEVLTVSVMSAVGKDRVDAEAFVETNLGRYWNWFLEELDSERARGITPFFSVSDPNRNSFTVRHEELAASIDPPTARRGAARCTDQDRHSWLKYLR